MKKYDSEQLKAINACDGYFLVLAPPGCGKTDILSERIIRAKEQGVSFDDMLCLTFTNRASKGMRDRVKQKVGEDANSIFVGNVHRFCSNFIFSNALVPENSAIIDERDMADILMGFNHPFFLNKLGMPDKAKVTMVDNIDAYISQKELKQPDASIFLPQEEYEKYYQTAINARFNPDNVTPLYEILKYTLMYRQYKKEHNIISFSDMLILAYEGLRKDKKHEYKRYPWIQVDEVQDLNALQTAIIDELIDKEGDSTVMYLGDEQQAIFSFLGAKLGHLEALKKRCAGHIMNLGTNYRSPKYLLDIFNTFAEKELHIDPSLLPQPNSEVEHNAYDLILTGNNTTEAEENRVSKMLDFYLKNENERVAILVPTNDAADRISIKLDEKGIGHFKISGTDMFKTKSYKTLSSFFSVIVNDFNSLAWSRLLVGIGAVSTGADARNLVAKLKELMMTPSDLFHDKSYIARFNRDYMTREFVFFDTETTGLNVLQDDIVQIAAFKVNKGVRVEGSDFNILLHTDKPIPCKLGEIDNPLIEEYNSHTHYSREEGLRMFLDYIGECPLLGHNVNYDYNILKENVKRTLGIDVDNKNCYDSLHLIKCVEPDLAKYKLAFLLKELKLEGKNSHLADEDIAATKALVDYCHKKSRYVIAKQQAFMSQNWVKNVVERMMPLQQMFNNLNDYMYQRVQDSGRDLADEMKTVYDDMVSMNLIEDLGEKFNVFLKYARSEWVDSKQEESVYDQICSHINDMTASINEGDLVNSEDLIKERVFIMTVYKGKGLEFDNVIVLQANDGTYPFFSVNRVLQDPWHHTKEEVAKAQQERMEDARKFYVALSRAKKRLCISYTLRNSYGYDTKITPFMRSIETFFHTGKEKRANTPANVLTMPQNRQEKGAGGRNIDGSGLSFNQDTLISFDEASHTYYVEGVGNMTPVSTVIGMFFVPFDAETVSMRKCQGDVAAAARLREEWDFRGAIASQVGTFMHKQIENYLNDRCEPQSLNCEVVFDGNYIHERRNIEISREWAYFKAFDRDTTYQPFRTEWCVFDTEARMAGTIDLLCSKSDGTFEIFDWKRSSRINPGEDNKWDRGINGLQHLPDTAYIHYCIQQNLYRYMLEKNYGIKVSRINLVALHPDLSSYKLIPIPRMEQEVRTIINYLTKN